MECPLTPGQPNSINISDVKEMQQLIEGGVRTLNEIETFFNKYNKKLLPMIRFLNEDISKFVEIYEFILQVKDEAFKTDHWLQIFRALYQNREEMYENVKNNFQTINITMNFLMKENVLKVMQFVQNLTLEAKEDFKSNQNISDIFHDFQNF